MVSGNHAVEDCREASRTQPIMVYRDTACTQGSEHGLCCSPRRESRQHPCSSGCRFSKIYALGDQSFLATESGRVGIIHSRSFGPSHTEG
jgi:hypothetical protein